MKKYSHDILAPEECRRRVSIAEREESDDDNPDEPEIVDTVDTPLVIVAKTGPTTDQLGGVTQEPMVMPTQPIEAVSHKSGHEVASGQTVHVSLPGPTAPGSGQAVHVSLPGPTTLASGQAIDIPLPGRPTLAHDSGYEPTSEQSATTLLPIFNSAPYDDARFGDWGQFNPLQISNEMPTQYQVPSDSWFNNLLNLPSLQTTDVASTFTQTFPQGPVDDIPSLQNINLVSTFTHACPQVPTDSSGIPGQNVLPGTFFFLSASPLPAVPTPSMVHPPLFRQDLPEARDAAPQLSSLLHLPVNDAPPTVPSSSQQLAPSLPHVYQPLLSSSNEVTLPHHPSLETSHASSPVLSVTPVYSVEKENDQPTVLKGVVKNRRKRKVDDVVQEQIPARVKAKETPEHAPKSRRVSNLPDRLKEGGYAPPKKGKRGKKAT